MSSSGRREEGDDGALRASKLYSVTGRGGRKVGKPQKDRHRSQAKEGFQERTVSIICAAGRNMNVDN